MKAISLWQPWASLWCSRRKVHETRHWRCSHRGWPLVHAGKHFEKTFELDDPLRLILDDEFGGDWANTIPDRIAGLGPELQVLAEKHTKEINLAYHEAQERRGRA